MEASSVLLCLKKCVDFCESVCVCVGGGDLLSAKSYRTEAYEAVSLNIFTSYSFYWLFFFLERNMKPTLSPKCGTDITDIKNEINQIKGYATNRIMIVFTGHENGLSQSQCEIMDIGLF